MEKTEKKKKSLLRRILNAVGVVFMLALTGLLLFIVLSNASGNVTFIAGKTVAWVRTESMEPVIPAKSYILVEEVPDPYALADGEVIMFRSTDPSLGGSLNTHRIVGRDDRGWYITKGDHNSQPDKKHVNPVAVRGRFVKNLPVLTYAGRFISEPIGMVVMILAILGITAAAFAPDIAAIFKAKANNNKQQEMDERIKAEVERLKAAKENGADSVETRGQSEPKESAASDEAPNEASEAPEREEEGK